jgi:hypothetical protein
MMDSGCKLKIRGVLSNITYTHVKSFIDSPMATEIATCITVRLISEEQLRPSHMRMQ